jgi:hypothetical protein
MPPIERDAHGQGWLFSREELDNTRRVHHDRVQMGAPRTTPEGVAVNFSLPGTGVWVLTSRHDRDSTKFNVQGQGRPLFSGVVSCAGDFADGVGIGEKTFISSAGSGVSWSNTARLTDFRMGQVPLRSEADFRLAESILSRMVQGYKCSNVICPHEEEKDQHASSDFLKRIGFVEHSRTWFTFFQKDSILLFKTGLFTLSGGLAPELSVALSELAIESRIAPEKLPGLHPQRETLSLNMPLEPPVLSERARRVRVESHQRSGGNFDVVCSLGGKSSTFRSNIITENSMALEAVNSSGQNMFSAILVNLLFDPNDRRFLLERGGDAALQDTVQLHFSSINLPLIGAEEAAMVERALIEIPRIAFKRSHMISSPVRENSGRDATLLRNMGFMEFRQPEDVIFFK